MQTSTKYALAGTGLALLAVFAIGLSIAWLGLSIWAIVFGIIDLATVGLNGWAIAWIIIGGVGVIAWLGNLFHRG